VRNYDLEFLKRFSLVIGFLVLVTLGLIIGALVLHRALPQEVDPSVAKRTEARIGGAGAVSVATAAAQVAYGGTLDGSVVYQNLCAGCHTSGAGGAPTLVQAQWNARIAQGMDTLYRHSIEGFVGNSGVMPAKGGNPALTDEQVQATVDWMVGNLK
jgi:cytochrome c5